MAITLAWPQISLVSWDQQCDGTGIGLSLGDRPSRMGRAPVQFFGYNQFGVIPVFVRLRIAQFVADLRKKSVGAEAPLS
jgi:hypothetical protein